MSKIIKEFAFSIPIIQVFKNVHLYGKENKSALEREKNLAWRKINSNCGFINNNELFLPESFTDFQIKNPSTVLILVDNNPPLQNNLNYSNAEDKESDLIPLILDVPREFEVFHIHHLNELSLSLNYSYFKVGLPSRDNFRLSPLLLDQPLEIRINGKIDHNLTSSRARLFKEQRFIFHYLGNFNTATFLAPNQIQSIKEVPKPTNTVDLIKALW